MKKINNNKQQKTTNSKPLTRRQIRAIPMLVESKTITEGTRALGIDRTCFYEWMKNPIFQKEYYTQLQQYVRFSTKGLSDNAEMVNRKLLELINSPDDNIKLEAMKLFYRIQTNERAVKLALKEIEIELEYEE